MTQILGLFGFNKRTTAILAVDDVESGDSVEMDEIDRIKLEIRKMVGENRVGLAVLSGVRYVDQIKIRGQKITMVTIEHQYAEESTRKIIEESLRQQLGPNLIVTTARIRAFAETD